MFCIYSSLWYFQIFDYFRKHVSTGLLVSLCTHFFIEFRFCETSYIPPLEFNWLEYCVNLEQLNIDLPYVYICTIRSCVNSNVLSFPPMFCVFCISHFIDIPTASKNIRNIHAVSNNQIGDILYVNDNIFITDVYPLPPSCTRCQYCTLRQKTPTTSDFRGRKIENSITTTELSFSMRINYFVIRFN